MQVFAGHQDARTFRGRGIDAGDLRIAQRFRAGAVQKGHGGKSHLAGLHQEIEEGIEGHGIIQGFCQGRFQEAFRILVLSAELLCLRKALCNAGEGAQNQGPEAGDIFHVGENMDLRGSGAGYVGAFAAVPEGRVGKAGAICKFQIEFPLFIDGFGDAGGDAGRVIVGFRRRQGQILCEKQVKICRNLSALCAQAVGYGRSASCYVLQKLLQGRDFGICCIIHRLLPHFLQSGRASPRKYQRRCGS